MIRFLFSNWKAKIGSLFIAVLLYANLQNSKVLQKTINIPVEYPKLSSSLFYGETPEKTIPVRVEGLRDSVNYYSQFMKAIVDIEGIQTGENELQIKKIQGIPNGVRVTKLKDSVKVTIETNSSKIVPLEPVFDGQLPTDIEKTSFILQPNRITITGRESDLDKINRIVLPPVSLTDKKESFSKRIRIPDLGKGVFIQSKSREVVISVNLSVSGFNGGEQTVVGIPVTCIGTSKYLQPELSEEQISVRFFSQKPVRSIQIINGIQANVPCYYTYDPVKKKILPSNLPVSVKVRVNKSKDLKNIEILQIKPEKITISYKVKEESQFEESVDEDKNPDDEDINVSPQTDKELQNFSPSQE